MYILQWTLVLAKWLDAEIDGVISELFTSINLKESEK